MIISKGRSFKGLTPLEYPVEVLSITGTEAYDSDGEIRGRYNGTKDNAMVSVLYDRTFSNGTQRTFIRHETVSPEGDFSLSQCPWGFSKNHVVSVRIEVSEIEDA